MPKYNAKDFEPPAPFAYVRLLNPDTKGGLSDVPMLIDTGADVTLIPRFVANELSLFPSADVSYELEGFEGSTVNASAVYLELYFLGRTFRGQFLLIDEVHGILGRNVLNALALFYDGPNLFWDELRPARRD